MTSSITMAEREGTGAQERHWQPRLALHLYRLCSDCGNYSSNPVGPRASLSRPPGVVKSGHDARSTAEPGRSEE